MFLDDFVGKGGHWEGFWLGPWLVELEGVVAIRAEGVVMSCWWRKAAGVQGEDRRSDLLVPVQRWEFVRPVSTSVRRNDFKQERRQRN